LTNLKRQVSLGRAFGLEAEIVDATRTAELWPLLRTDDVIGAVWSPADGRANPSDIALALSKGAKAQGVRFFEDTRVTGLRKSVDRISGVEVGEHVIEADEVVIACGLWSREVAAMAGADMPLYACEHFYMLTKPLPEITGHLPTLNDQDSFLYARDDVGGLLVGSFEPHAKGLPLENLPADFSFDLLGEDWDHFAPMMENALSRIPALETAEVRMLLNGPESFTADSQFMLGESPDVPGLFMIGGMNSTGIALAGGAGRAMAEWIIAGAPTMDLNEADIRRFGREANVLGALAARIPEVLGKHYELAFPGRVMDTARGQRRSPVHFGLKEAGAVFTARNGWERAMYFSPDGPRGPVTFEAPPWRDLEAVEQNAARDGAALLDQSAFGKLRIMGAGALAFLNKVCAAEMDVAPGRIAYSQVLNEKGGIEADVTVQRHGSQDYLMITGAGEVTRMLMHLRRRKPANVEIADETSGWAIIGLAGAKAADALRAAGGDPDMPRFGLKPVEVGLACGFIGRLSFTGQPGYELYIPSDMAMAAWEALLPHAKPIGMFATGALRIEAGFRAWGHEMGPGITPQEAGTEKFLAEGDFIGKAKVQTGNRRVASILFDDPEGVPLHDEPIWRDGQVIGQITSTGWSARLNRAVALSLMTEPPKPGEVIDVEVEIACDRFPARAMLAPLSTVEA
ncbi:MAG: GcvT family protein, partial [Pikeienuella sp.]